MRTVADVMTREVFALAPDTSLEVAGRLMYRQHVSGLPVVDAGGVAIGVVTAKDLVDPDRRRSEQPGSGVYYKLSAGGCETLDGGAARLPGRAADVMTSFVVAVSPDSSVEDAARLMVSDDIHRLFVVDAGRRITGLISSMDALRALLAG